MINVDKQTINRHLNSMPEQFGDLLYCPHGTLPALISHHDFYPFDRIFCPPVFVVYCHPQIVVADPFIYFFGCFIVYPTPSQMFKLGIPLKFHDSCCLTFVTQQTHKMT